MQNRYCRGPYTTTIDLFFSQEVDVRYPLALPKYDTKVVLLTFDGPQHPSDCFAHQNWSMLWFIYLPSLAEMG